MPGQNLSAQEARERSSIISEVEYQVDLSLDASAERFQSHTKVDFTAHPASSTFIDLIAPSVKRIVLNGQDIPLANYRDSRIELFDLLERNHLEVEAECAYMHTGEGLHRFTDPADHLTYCYSQFEVPDARRVYACFEQPDLKATYQFNVTVPSDWIVLSNSRTPAPEPVTVNANPEGVQTKSPSGENPRHTFCFAKTPKISTYITAFVAGPFHEVRDELTSCDGRQIPLGVYVRQSLVKYLDADFILDQTKRGFEFYEQQFARPYPFDNYDQIFVPEYNAGAMENAGCVTLRDEYVFRTPPTTAQLEALSDTILHELAHMWFGDLVTMKWWDDLWLNESFAEFMSYWCMSEATQFSNAWTGFCIRKVWGVNCDQMPTTHPIVAPIKDLADVEVNFDGITYSKGACVLRQLVSWVGLESFLKALHAYFEKHQWSNATLQDLLTELETVSGKDLDSWVKVWLLEAGITQLEGVLERDQNGKVTSYRVHQTLPLAGTSLRPHSLTIGAYDFDDNNQLVLQDRFQVEITANSEVTEVPKLVGTSYPVYVLNDTDVAYAKIRLDKDSWQVVQKRIECFADSLPRAVLMCAAWDMVRDGDFSAPEYLRLALKALTTEKNSTVLGGIIRHASAALFYYTDEPLCYQPLLSEGLFHLAQSAEPGSDLQQQLVKGFLSVAGETQSGTILEWFKSGKVFPGVHVAQDLKWQMVQTLASCGIAESSELIETMLQEDDTITGREEAVYARAALPGSENKMAWAKAVLENDQLTNGQLDSALGGIGASLWKKPSEGEKLLELYFAVLEQVWEEKTLHTAESIIEGLFPLELAGLGYDLEKLCQQWLDSHPDAPRALRRKVLEEQDGAKRAQRGRALSAKYGAKS